MGKSMPEQIVPLYNTKESENLNSHQEDKLPIKEQRFD
jgi:hypothetical protein